MKMTAAIREMTFNREPTQAIRRQARLLGMRTLLEDGIAKAAQGLTTLEDVLRVAPRDDTRGPAVAEPAAAVPDTEEPSAVSVEPTIAMPADVTPHRAEAPIAAPPAAAAPAMTPPPGGIRVLVVEDSPTIVQVVKYFLELEGYEVLCAADGEKGLAIARRERPHAVVSDVEMPRMSGIELVTALRRDPATRDMPVLLLSSQTSVESEAQGLSVGADDYVPKPVEPRRLAARVKALLNRTQDRWNHPPAAGAKAAETPTTDASVPASPSAAPKPKKPRVSRGSGKTPARKSAAEAPPADTPDGEPNPDAGVKEEPA
jgi:DNA-binding response OmpR family regulator